LGDFPLLIKLIDANEDLSVQVHPDDATAPAGKRGKTEAWFILDATPGARIVTGVDGAIEIDRIAAQLTESVVSAGDVYFVPAGTVHAIGAGVLLYEIQQTSDVTWRLYDWGRPREIHVANALAVARPESRVTSVSPQTIEEGRDLLVACRYFALERWQVDGEMHIPATPDVFRVLTVLSGRFSIDAVEIRDGASVVLPADLPESTLHGTGVVLSGYIPDLDDGAYVGTGESR
jgi:mannose-6-phosphate isomerase